MWIRRCVLLCMLILTLCAGTAMADVAREVTGDAKFSVPYNNNTIRRMRDRDELTAMQAGAQKNPTVTITMNKEECAAIYIEFGNSILPFEVQVKDGKNWRTVASWDEAYAQAYVEFEPAKELRLYFPSGKKYEALYIREIFLFSEGDMDESIVHIWQEPLEKADVLLLVAHPDDEVLWFGGTLPTLAGEKGLNVTAAWLTCGNTCRRLELLNSIWHCGVRNYPDIGEWDDIKSYNLQTLYSKWGKDDMDEYLVRLLRRYQPEVVITHAYDGEYGHAAHKVCAYSLTRAVELAADPSYDKKSAEEYGAWQVKKFYVHKTSEDLPTTVMDWHVPLDAFDGKTGYEIACEAYKMHASQPQDKNGKDALYHVQDAGEEHDASVYTLIYSTVGPDVKGGDFMENIPTGE